MTMVDGLTTSANEGTEVTKKSQFLPMKGKDCLDDLTCTPLEIYSDLCQYFAPWPTMLPKPRHLLNPASILTCHGMGRTVCNVFFGMMSVTSWQGYNARCREPILHRRAHSSQPKATTPVVPTRVELIEGPRGDNQSNAIPNLLVKANKPGRGVILPFPSVQR
jgi:hypothetical protein